MVDVQPVKESAYIPRHRYWWLDFSIGSKTKNKNETIRHTALASGIWSQNMSRPGVDLSW